MTQGAALPPPHGHGGGAGGGVWAWARPISIGLLLAIVLLVLLAGLLNDLLPGSGGGVISGPTQTPTPSVSVLPTTTESPVATDQPTDDGTGEGGGTGGGGGTDTGAGGGSGGSSGGSGGSGGKGGGGKGDPTTIPTPTRTGTPTPTITPPVPPDYPVGPNKCTVYSPPGYCFTRELINVSVKAGPLTLAKASATPVTGGTAAVVKLAPSINGSGPSVSGNIEPIRVVDARGSDEGWRLRADVAWPGGLPPGVLVTLDPWCFPVDGDAAPGVQPGRIAQSLDNTLATVCSKDAQVGKYGSTGGTYLVGATVSLSTWVGTPIPATAVLVTLSVN